MQIDIVVGRMFSIEGYVYKEAYNEVYNEVRKLGLLLKKTHRLARLRAGQSLVLTYLPSLYGEILSQDIALLVSEQLQSYILSYMPKNIL